MQRSTRYRQGDTGIEVVVTSAAEQLIGPRQVPSLIPLLTDMARILKAQYAYVSKRGPNVQIEIVNREGWAGIMSVKRGS